MGNYFKEFNLWSQCASRNMVLQVQEETWLENQEIQGTILCERWCSEETVSWTLELVFYNGPVDHSEIGVDFEVYYRFSESNYWLHKCLLSGRYSKWGSSIHWTFQGFQEWQRTMWCCYQIEEKLIWSIWIRTPLVWKFAKWFVRSRFCDDQVASLPVYV